MAALARVALSFAAPPEAGAWESGTEAEVADRLRAYVSGDRALAMVVEAGEDLIGFAACRRDGAPRAALDILAVAPGHRGHGIGTRLVSDMLEALRSRGVASLDVNVEAGNAAAVRFWRRAGFRDTIVRMTADLAEPVAQP